MHHYGLSDKTAALEFSVNFTLRTVLEERRKEPPIMQIPITLANLRFYLGKNIKVVHPPTVITQHGFNVSWLEKIESVELVDILVNAETEKLSYIKTKGSSGTKIIKREEIAEIYSV